ncbi:MAG: DUF4861 family protein, partial [Bacteroidetes bacterium]|nr:DUF4861 family protein [Bacteroidota bacterium]
MMRLNRLIFLLSAALIFETSTSPAAQNPSPSEKTSVFYFSAFNPANVSRPHELLSINLNRIRSKYPSFNPKAFVVTCEGKEVPSQ